MSTKDVSRLESYWAFVADEVACLISKAETKRKECAVFCLGIAGCIVAALQCEPRNLSAVLKFN